MMVARHKVPGKGANKIRPGGNGMSRGAELSKRSEAKSISAPTDYAVPSGTEFSMPHSRHFMPGYHQAIPSAQR